MMSFWKLTPAILLISHCFAYDWGEREGHILSHKAQHCFRDTQSDCIEENAIGEGETCLADAIGDRDLVFKVPNRTSWECDESCEAIDLRSRLIMLGAKVRNGPEKYGAMSFKHFMKIMGNRDICD